MMSGGSAQLPEAPKAGAGGNPHVAKVDASFPGWTRSIRFETNITPP